MPPLENGLHIAPVLDLRRQLQRPEEGHSHSHHARGIRVEASPCDPERVHYHRTAAGMSEPAANRPGHRHRLPNGLWTNSRIERWSCTGVGRL